MASVSSTLSWLNVHPIQHAPEHMVPHWMKRERTRTLFHAEINENNSKRSNDAIVNANNDHSSAKTSCVVYWMHRDVRAVDNWALLWSLYLATQHYKIPLRVLYVLQPPPLQQQEPLQPDEPPILQNLPMTSRHGSFLLSGLEQVHEALYAMNIPLHVLMPLSNDDVGTTVYETAVTTYHATVIVTDMTPIRQYRQWIECQLVPLLHSIQQEQKKSKQGESSSVILPSVYQVDAHNVVPVWIASTKREYGARTIRSKIQKIVSEYSKVPYPSISDIVNANTSTTTQMSFNKEELPVFNRTQYEEYMKLDSSVGILDWAQPGTKAGMEQFQKFIDSGLSKFDTKRNDPVLGKQVCSNLSPWINHGHVSFQRLMYTIQKLNKHANGTAMYIEEGLIRRELSDNYCFYAPDTYDTLDAAYDWARETLQVHSADQREHVYTLEQLECGCTHDDLWNAAQLQAVHDGKMHGFLRMYWAKKILEWTESPSHALLYGHYLNDKFNIDGRDPNGFVGVGWSIMGIHDQGWSERSVFGKIRYMNYAGCKRKFNVPQFVAMYHGASENAMKVSQKLPTATGTKPKQKQTDDAKATSTLKGTTATLSTANKVTEGKRKANTSTSTMSTGSARKRIEKKLKK